MNKFLNTAKPRGPYSLDMAYRGVSCKITVKNIGEDELAVKIVATQELSEEFITDLKEYLRLEGFYDEARIYNSTT